MAQDPKKPVNINFNIDPHKTKVLYADGYLLTSNEHVVVFNFAQGAPDPTQQTVVARIALTPAQAKEFVSNLSNHIEKFEV